MSTEKQRLFIKKIEIENVGRFYGKDHSIEFSDSEEKNITIVIGLSGSGKSTLHDMIYWCLYGEFKKHSSEENAKLDYGLINSDALENLSEGETVSALVTISLHDNSGEKYRLTRRLKATYNKDSTTRKFELQNNSKVPVGIDFETSVKLFYRDESGNMDFQDNPQLIKSEINIHFPQHLSDFFLFDGENLLKFSTTSSSDFIKNGITKISGLGLLDSMANSATNTADNITKYIGGKNVNAAPYVSKQSKLRQDKSEIKNIIKECKQKKEKAKQLLEETIAKIAKSKEGNELIREENEVNKSKMQISKELRDINDKIKNTLFEKIPQLLIRETLQKSEQVFAKLENEDKIPPSISRGAIDKILGSDPLRCVCGREFEKNENQGSPWTILNQIKNAIIEDDISQGISHGRNWISRIIDVNGIKKTRKEFNELKERRREKRKDLDEHKVKIIELNRQLKNVQYLTSDDLHGLKEKFFKQLSEYESIITVKESELGDLEIDIDKNEKKLYDVLQKEDKYESERKKITLAKAVVKFTRTLEKRIEEILRKNTEDATSKYFLESAPEKDTFDHVEISENYDILVKDSKGRSAKLSKGQAHVLGLSYVAGIRKITYTNTFLIIDSPLHNISGKARNEISEVFSKYIPGVQLILLVTDTEYLHEDPDKPESVKKILRKSGHIWKEYMIDTKEVNGIESREIREYEDNG